MLKNYFIFFLLFLNFLLFSNELPQPKDNLLYTEFVSYKYSPFLKKPGISSGIIAMDGKEKFIFKQLKPVIFILKKIDGRFTFQRQNTKEVAVDGETYDNDFMMLFGDSNKLAESFNIVENKVNTKSIFTITPKTENKILKMIITAKGDAFEKIEMLFNDNSKLIYEFRNTVTGKKPDEKIFE